MRDLQAFLSRRYHVPLSLMQVGQGGAVQSKGLYFAFQSGQRVPLLAVRVSRNENYSQRVREEFALRKEFLAKLSQPLKESVPWVDLCEEPGPILIEPFLPGRALPYPAGARAFSRQLSLVMGWIQSFQDATGPKEADLIGMGSQLLEALRGLLPRHRSWLEEVECLLPLLKAATPCLVHGDFWRGNLRCHHGKLRVIDWEYVREAGNPWFDPLLNLVSLACEASDSQAAFEEYFLRPSRYSRVIGQSLSGDRDAIAVSLLLVVLELIYRDIRNGLDLEKIPHYALLRRLVLERELVSAIQKALWPN